MKIDKENIKVGEFYWIQWDDCCAKGKLFTNLFKIVKDIEDDSYSWKYYLNQDDWIAGNAVQFYTEEPEIEPWV